MDNDSWTEVGKNYSPPPIAWRGQMVAGAWVAESPWVLVELVFPGVLYYKEDKMV